MIHEVHRDVTDEETRLWERLCAHAGRDAIDTVPLTRIGTTEVDLHEMRVRQIARTWDNEGLVKTIGDANYVSITEYGRQVDDIESTLVSGEEW